MGRGEAKRSTPSSSFAPEEPPSKRTKLDHLPTSGHPGSAASPPQGSTRQTNDGRGTDVRGANLGPAGDDGVIVSELTGLEAGEDDGTAVTAEVFAAQLKARGSGRKWGLAQARSATVIRSWRMPSRMDAALPDATSADQDEGRTAGVEDLQEGGEDVEKGPQLLAGASRGDVEKHRNNDGGQASGRGATSHITNTSRSTEGLGGDGGASMNGDGDKESPSKDPTCSEKGVPRGRSRSRDATTRDSVATETPTAGSPKQGSLPGDAPVDKTSGVGRGRKTRAQDLGCMSQQV